MNSTTPKPRKYLQADALIAGLRQRFEAIDDPRQAAKVDHTLADCLMAAFAMFSLKEPSLLAFDQRRTDRNLLNLYRIDSIPSDTQHRAILDNVDPADLSECFADIFYELQRGGQLKPFVFADGHYLIAIDGTGTFGSTKIRCPHCLVKTNRGGKTEYAHQMVVAALVHPDLKTVIPLAVEPIINADGDNKNDCERNAVRRLLQTLRRQHPKLKAIVLEDGLASNGPHIEDLIAMNFGFLLGAKPGDHAYLFKNFETAESLGLNQSVTTAAVGKTPSGVTRFNDHLQLNASHLELQVGLIEHTEYATDGSIARRFSWVTGLPIDATNVMTWIRAGRCRWKIENETFNTLKNQGYHLEHNFGHGRRHLSTVFAVLMCLAFLVDQVQQHCCGLFAAATARFNTRRAYWDHLRSCFDCLVLSSWRGLYEAIADGRSRGRAAMPGGS